MNRYPWQLAALLSLSLYGATPWAAEDHGPARALEIPRSTDAHEHSGEEEENRVHLTEQQLRTAGIRVEALTPRPLGVMIEAPGQILLNAYATSQVTPRIQAQVVARYAGLGDAVRAGQALVALSSVAMAEAQGELLVNAKEWDRVKTLGKDVTNVQVTINTEAPAWRRRRSNSSSPIPSRR